MRSKAQVQTNITQVNQTCSPRLNKIYIYIYSLKIKNKNRKGTYDTTLLTMFEELGTTR